jgi:hypothetical protein
MGRPKVHEVRSMQLKLNLTAKEYEGLVRRAEAVGMRLTHFSRAIVVSTDASAPREKISDNTEKLIYLALMRVGNNLNQMMRYLHRTGEPVPADLGPLLSDIRQIFSTGIKKWL